MRKVVAMATIVATAPFVTGCLSAVNDEPKNDPESRNETYLNAVRKQDPSLTTVRDGALIENAELTCQHLDLGGTFTDLFQISVETGMPAKTAGVLTASAVVFFCPEYRDDLERYVGEVDSL